ncbi:HlyD family secretion protein [Mangrovibacterium lignilyticum]|uniref:HlyD family secretion protein n=1 Tax=Mangrovibacterium lignilyticum TaxID=2668052 RepID=UPI0013D7071E|nr:HlyD family secretion protein [Mangrovibacterium lignilyticum]
MSKKFKTVYLPVLLVLVLVIGGGIYWYLDYLKYASTDDAFVEFNMVTASPKMMGRIAKLYVDEGDHVESGTLLFELDSTDLVAEKSYLQSMQVQSEAKARETAAKFALSKEQLNVLGIEVDKTEKDFHRAEVQYKGGVITKEAYDHAEDSFKAAKARYASGQKDIALEAAAQKSAEASVQAAFSQIELVKSKLDDAKVYAPSGGVIAKRWLLEGDVVQAGQSVYSVVENDEVWVKVYLEETKLGGIHNGSKSKYTIDAYPDVTFEGKVIYVGASTESQFSLIPPNNASGNFTKVTQRIPLKVSIQDVENSNKYPLLSGMSVVVKIERN